jgi:hypothetical protein
MKVPLYYEGNTKGLGVPSGADLQVSRWFPGLLILDDSVLTVAGDPNRAM